MSIVFSTPGCMGQGAKLPLDGLYRMGQGEGKGVTGTSPALPLRGAAMYGVTVWGRPSCQLVLGSAGWLSLLSPLCDHLGGDMTLPGRGHAPAWEERVPPGLSPGCRAVPHPAWETGSRFSVGVEWGAWLCWGFQRFPRAWAVMLWGMGGQHVPACNLPGNWQCGHGVPGAGERPGSGQGCVYYQHLLLEASPCQHGTAGITRDRSQGLSLLSPSWVVELSEQGPPNPGWFAVGRQGDASVALGSKEGALMGVGWEVGAGPAMGVFPHSVVVLKIGAEDEDVVDKPFQG